MDYPIKPDIESNRPAPDVTVIQQTVEFIFGAYTLSSTIDETVNNRKVIAFTLLDEDENVPDASLIIAKCWLISETSPPRDFELNPHELLQVAVTGPNVTPSTSFNLCFSNGAASLTIEHTLNPKTWYLAVEINSFVNVLGPFNFGA